MGAAAASTPRALTRLLLSVQRQKMGCALPVKRTPAAPAVLRTLPPPLHTLPKIACRVLSRSLLERQAVPVNPSTSSQIPILERALDSGARCALKSARVERQRVRKRQLGHQTHQRASVEEQGALAASAMGMSEPDYRRRLDMLWAFTARFRLAKTPMPALDAAMSDYAGFGYPNLFLLFNRALKGWRKASPTRSKVEHSEGATYACRALLVRRGISAMALFNVSLLSIFVRPSASVTLAAADVVDPPPASTRLSAFHAHPLVPQERLVWTKTGEYDAVVLLDNVRHPMLATESVQLRDAQKVVAGHIDPDDVVAPWPYRIRYFLTEWMAAVQEPESLTLIESPYEEPCSGPSRDTLLCLRAKEEVSGRVHRITLASLCYYERGASL